MGAGVREVRGARGWEKGERGLCWRWGYGARGGGGGGRACGACTGTVVLVCSMSMLGSGLGREVGAADSAADALMPMLPQHICALASLGPRDARASGRLTRPPPAPPYLLFCREQLAKLKAVGGPMFKRAAEHEARPKVRACVGGWGGVGEGGTCFQRCHRAALMSAALAGCATSPVARAPFRHYAWLAVSPPHHHPESSIRTPPAGPAPCLSNRRPCRPPWVCGCAGRAARAGLCGAGPEGRQQLARPQALAQRHRHPGAGQEGGPGPGWGFLGWVGA